MPAVRPNSRQTTRMDPTRTTMIRRRFMVAMSQGFLKLKSAVTKLIVTEDAFGLKQKTRNPGVLTTHQRYVALTTSQQVAEFKKWVQEQVDRGILKGVDTGAPNWMQQYINEAYEKGSGRAFDDYMTKYGDYYSKPHDYFQGTRDEFMRSSFRRPASAERVSLLASRSYTDLKGVTADMSTKMNRILTDGMIQGKNPRDVARELNKAVEVGRKRALTIARTETIRAHADGQLEALKSLGVREVGVMVEWSTAADDLVCDLCADLDGIVVDIAKAGGMIPRHPNCRCAWIPANVGEPDKGQARGPAAQQKIDSSIRSEIPKSMRGSRTLEDQRKLSRWQGADMKVGRPAKKFTEKEVQKILKGGTKPPVPPKPVPPPPPPVVPKPVVETKKTGFVVSPEKPPAPSMSELKSMPIEKRLAQEDLEKIRLDFLSKVSPEGPDAAIKLEFERSNLESSVQALLNKRNSFKEGGAAWHKANVVYSMERNRLDQVYATLGRIREGGSTKLSAAEVRKMLAVPADQKTTILAEQSKTSVKFAGDKGKLLDTMVVGGPDKKLRTATDFLESVTTKNAVNSVSVNSHTMPGYERAFHLSGSGVKDGIYLNEYSSTKTYVHELGHRLEDSIKGAQMRATEFRDMRIARAGTKDEYLSAVFPKAGYQADEKGNPDEFTKAFTKSEAYYVGKKYAHKSTEVVSMGVQMLYENPVQFAQKDPEYFKFIVGLLRGVI